MGLVADLPPEQQLLVASVAALLFGLATLAVARALCT